MKMVFAMLQRFLQSKRGVKMKKNYLFFCVLSCLLMELNSAIAKVDTTYAKAWMGGEYTVDPGIGAGKVKDDSIESSDRWNMGYLKLGSSKVNFSSAIGDFIIDGALKKGGKHGTYGDEWAVVALVAEQVVEHGGYFCPYQLQCANKHGNGGAWLRGFEPTGYSKSKCAWFCEKGYTGTNCGPQKSVLSGMNTPTNTRADGLFSGVTMKQSGKDKNDKISSVVFFRDSFSWSCKNKKKGSAECSNDVRKAYVMLGGVAFKEHGIVATPVYLECYAQTNTGNHSWVRTLGIFPDGKQELLCAEGYTPNSSETDCVLVTEEMLAVTNALEETGLEFCSGWDESKFDSKIHTMDTSTEDCARFWCTESGKAFKAVGDTTCVDCATGIKGGQSKINGTCVKCETGQFFDKDSGECKSAAAYSKMDLQYGKGKTKNSNMPLENQCWTILTPEEYRKCVESGGAE